MPRSPKGAADGRLRDQPRDHAQVSGAPAPPTEIDPAEITRTARRRRAGSLAAAVVTALVVAAVVVTVLALTHTGAGRPQQAASAPATSTTVSRQPSDLVGSWDLTDLQGLDGTAHTEPDAELAFRIASDGAVSQGCTAARPSSGRARCGSSRTG